MLQRTRYAIEPRGYSKSFQNEECTVKHAPYDEIPTRTVPETAQEEDCNQVEISPSRAQAITSQRYIKVVPEPIGEGYVPTFPELSNGAGDIRIVEVLEYAEPEHATHPNGHVGVTGEIEEYLQRITDDPEPGKSRGEMRGWDSEYLISYDTEDVGDEDFLPESSDKPLHPTGEVSHTLCPLGQLRNYVMVANDRSGDELGEEDNIEAKIDRVLLGRCHPPIDVNEIGE